MWMVTANACISEVLVFKEMGYHRMIIVLLEKNYLFMGFIQEWLPVRIAVGKLKLSVVTWGGFEVHRTLVSGKNIFALCKELA